ncbi:MAG: hypothetical protein QM642_05135 [Edaphocola sp.]
MKISEVPHDNEDFKDKSKIHKLLYVTCEDGTYDSVNSEGWEVENLATRQAWEAMLEDQEQTLQQVKNGTASPIAYFMKKCLMDLPVLAGYVGKWQWQVKRHLKPDIFAKLGQATLRRYAKAFNITAEELTSLAKQ